MAHEKQIDSRSASAGLGSKPGYWRQLDGLRAFSVAAVAWSHWRTHWDSKPSIFPGAELGVETFFVISGFLITGILLDNRWEGDVSPVLKTFYCRRFLRIFPLFYATLIIALCLDSTGLRETWYWHAGYLSNIYFYFHGWLGYLSPFWSLAVEEQFYLAWPLLILCLHPRYLLPVIVTCILAAPVYVRVTNTTHPVMPDIDASILMPSCLSALGIGALIAYCVRQQMPTRLLMRWGLVAGLAGVALWHGVGSPAPVRPFYRLAEDCILGWLVFSAAEGVKGPAGWILDCPPVRYLGKISYGVYIIHGFAYVLITGGLSLLRCPQWMVKFSETEAVRVCLLILVTVGLASFSWYFFEKPINNLKRNFSYPLKPESRAAGKEATRLAASRS